MDDLPIDMYRPGSAELTGHPVGSDCGRGKSCVHLLQLVEDVAHPLLHIFELNPDITLGHAGGSSRDRASRVQERTRTQRPSSGGRAVVRGRRFGRDVDGPVWLHRTLLVILTVLLGPALDPVDAENGDGEMPVIDRVDQFLAS